MYFHDGLFQRISFDFEAKELLVHLLVYSDPNATARNSVAMKFENVGYASFTGDFNELRQNAFAGNIVDVRLPDGDRTTRLYLTGGTLIVCSESLTVERADR